jgi:hypothetical protein
MNWPLISIKTFLFVVSLLFINSFSQANTLCVKFYNNIRQLIEDKTPAEEFAFRLIHRDFRTPGTYSPDPSIVVVRYAIGEYTAHYAARVVDVTARGELVVIDLTGERRVINGSDLASAKMGGYTAVATFTSHEKDFPFFSEQNKRNGRERGRRENKEGIENIEKSRDVQVSMMWAKESVPSRAFVLDEYARVLRRVAPSYDSKKVYQESDFVYINRGYWREWLADIKIPDQGWKVHVSSPVEMAGTVAAAILPKLRERKFLHKVVSDLSGYARKDPEDTQYGKFITIYPRNDREAVQIRNMLVDVLRDQNLDHLKFPHPPGEMKVAPGVFARYGRLTSNNLVINGRTIDKSSHLLLLPNGKIIRDERGSSTPEGIQNPF